MFSLTPTFERPFDFSVLLVQPLASLFRERILVSVRGVMPGQDIDGGVKSAETRLSSDLGETAVVRDEVDHLLLHVLSEVFHTIGTLSKSCGEEHVVTDLGGILVVFEFESPVIGERIRRDLIGHVNSGGGDAGKASGSDNSSRRCSCCLQEFTAGRSSRFLSS